MPKQLLSSIPERLTLKRDEFDLEAQEYVQSQFADHLGKLDQLCYPKSHQAARRWLKHFLKHRFHESGDYEDAIV